MPKGATSSKFRCQKRRKLIKTSRCIKIINESQKEVLPSTASLIEDRRAIKEHLKEMECELTMRKENRHFEKYDVNRHFNWTGLRNRPNSEIEGRNWTIYYCLTKYCKKRNIHNFPSDVMVSINQFLNWVPAGCWSKSKNNCSECNIKYLDYDIFGATVCSWQCYEKNLRSRIMEDFITSYNYLFEVCKNSNVVTYDDANYKMYLIGYKRSYDGNLYSDQHSLIQWYSYLHETDDMSDIVGFGYSESMYSVDNCSTYDSEFDYSMMLAIHREDEAEFYKYVNSQEELDDIWTNYRPHWGESLINVFPYISRYAY